MNNTILSVKNLKTSFQTPHGVAMAVDNISFDIKKGETFVMVGESGCGKSVTALSVLRLIQEPAGKICGGSINFRGEDLLKLAPKEMRLIRGNRISMIFQEPATSLNPVLTIGEQIMEVICLHSGISRKEARKQAIDMLSLVKIPDPAERFSEYPHQLSGGMKQRVMIAIALSCEPDLLIADEPTTALDVTVQAEILNLMKELQKKKGTSILLITHDMSVVYEMADHIAVMYAGKIVETDNRNNFFKEACHPYTVKLFESLPNRNKRGAKLSIIPGRVPPATGYPSSKCRFSDRCHEVFERCLVESPPLRSMGKEHKKACHLEEAKKIDVLLSATAAIGGTQNKKPKNKTLLEVKDLKIYYPIRKGILKRIVGHVKAVDGVNISVKEGETVALVGESGCGKTTAGKAIICLTDIAEGSVNFQGKELFDLSQNELKPMRKDFQIMFQDPYASLNPRMMAGRIISEGLLSQGIGKNKKERESIVLRMMEKVGLDPDMTNRYPHEFSGGQRQRIGIARFLALSPKFVVCDEVTSALDVSVQAQILNLLKDLQEKEDLSYLFITHNLSVVSYMANRVAVMYLGRIVEEGDINEIMDNARHPYTKALLAASPVIGEDGKEKLVLEGDVPSPSNPPQGCHFSPRCPKVMTQCGEKYPASKSFSESHRASCWLYH